MNCGFIGVPVKEKKKRSRQSTVCWSSQGRGKRISCESEFRSLTWLNIFGVPFFGKDRRYLYTPQRPPTRFASVRND